MNAQRRIKNKAGFSLAETLLAVLILLLVSGIVTAGIPAAKNAYEKVVIGSNAQILLSTTVSALRNELGTARNVERKKVKLKGTKYDALIYTSANTGAKTALYLMEDTKKATNIANNTVFIQELSEIENPEIKPRLLVSDATATDDLYVTFDLASSSVDSTTGLVTIVGLQVFRSGKTKSDAEPLAALPGDDANPGDNGNLIIASMPEKRR